MLATFRPVFFFLVLGATTGCAVHDGITTIGPCSFGHRASVGLSVAPKVLKSYRLEGFVRSADPFLQVSGATVRVERGSWSSEAAFVGLEGKFTIDAWPGRPTIVNHLMGGVQQHEHEVVKLTVSHPEWAPVSQLVEVPRRTDLPPLELNLHTRLPPRDEKAE